MIMVKVKDMTVMITIMVKDMITVMVMVPRNGAMINKVIGVVNKEVVVVGVWVVSPWAVAAAVVATLSPPCLPIRNLKRSPPLLVPPSHRAARVKR